MLCNLFIIIVEKSAHFLTNLSMYLKYNRILTLNWTEYFSYILFWWENARG